MKRTMISIGLTSLAFLLVLFAACGKDYSTNSYNTNPPPPPPASNTVLLSGTSFTPSSLTVTKGTTVTWHNSDAYLTHTSTSDSGVWDTGDIPPGGSKTTTFATPGTYTFHCTYHRAMGMTGTITVQ